ncbi:chymotrypsin elastase family member 2A [Biomphalaria glabrata]|nr:chymotrypsin elastase family member 2A [Biomphalaria glabrata]
MEPGTAQNFTFPNSSRCDPLMLYRYGSCRVLTCARNERILPGNSYCDIFSRPAGRRLVRCISNLPCCAYGGTCRQICNSTEERFASTTECNTRVGFCCIPKNIIVAGPVTNTSSSTVTQRQGNLECGINNAVASRIVGGTVSRPSDWPWMVRFVFRQSPRNICAGVLVDDDTVVTVAHCVNGFAANQMDVIVGDHDIGRVDPGEELVPVSGLEISRNYVPGTRGNDFAIVKLARKIRFTTTKQPACLPDPSIPILPANNPNSQCFVAGWGVDESGRVSSQLRSAPVQLMNLSTCNTILNSLGGNVTHVPSDMICTDTSATRTDACLFDDGGALTCRDANSRFTLLGLVSEYSCGSLPAVYTRVDNYTSAVLNRL